MNTDRGCAPLSFSCLLHAVFACSMRCGSMPMYRWEAGGAPLRAKSIAGQRFLPLSQQAFLFAPLFLFLLKRKSGINRILLHALQDSFPHPASRTCGPPGPAVAAGGPSLRPYPQPNHQESRALWIRQWTMWIIFRVRVWINGVRGDQKRNHDRWAFLAGASAAR